MPEARGWDVELPNGVPHATEWIAAGFPTCVDGGSAPLGGEGPQQFILRHLGDNESRLWVRLPIGARSGCVFW